jgi:cation transporter-like permease
MPIYPLIAAHEHATIALFGVALGGLFAIIGGVITHIFTEAAKAEGKARQLAAAVAAYYIGD